MCPSFQRTGAPLLGCARSTRMRQPCRARLVVRLVAQQVMRFTSPAARGWGRAVRGAGRQPASRQQRGAAAPLPALPSPRGRATGRAGTQRSQG
jgi:hypothetical protein